MINKDESIELIPWVLSFNPEWVAQVLVEIANKPESAKAITEDFLAKIDYLNTKMVEFVNKCYDSKLRSENALWADLIKKVVDDYHAEADKLDLMTNLSLKTLVVYDLIDMAIETEMKDQELIKIMVEHYTQVGSMFQDYPDNMICLVAKMHELEEFLEENGEMDDEDLDDMDFDDEEDADSDDNTDNIIKFSNN